VASASSTGELGFGCLDLLLACPYVSGIVVAIILYASGQ